MLREKEIINEAISGNEQAFQKLLNLYKGRIFSYVLRLVKNYDDAEDITLEVFIRCFKSLKNYDQSKPFSNWVFAIAHNLVMDFFRRNKIEYEYIDEIHPVTESLEEQYRKQRDLERIESALGMLVPIDREIVILFHKEGHSYQEISEILRLPVTTIKTRLHRARKKLCELTKQLQQ